MNLDFDKLESPIGTVLVVVREGRLCSLDFSDFETRFEHLLHIRYPDARLMPKANPAGITDRIQRYFNGDFASFESLEVETGGTPFQQQVWQALREIQAGTTWAYGQLAGHIGSPKGSRAVGHANSLNPIAIVLPCHRVIGSNRALTGYGGGLHRKRWLLEHEKASFADGKIPNLQAVLPFDGG